MENRWDQPGVPHRGWRWVNVIDLCEDSTTCEACNHHPIRYVHVLEHDEYQDRLKVGCVCAEKLTEDYKNPRAKQTNLANKEARKKRLLQQWKTYRLITKRFRLAVFQDKKRRGFWKWGFIRSTGDNRGYTKISRQSYPSIYEARFECLNELFAKWLSNIV
jgi:hypothetical protein